MSPVDHSEDPEPCPCFPAGPLFVPVRPGPAGCVPRFLRTPLGARTAVGFTSVAQPFATLGTDHACIRPSEPALRALAVALGVPVLTVDPQFSAPAPGGRERESSWRDWRPRHTSALRVTGTATVVSYLNLQIG
ncbi:SAV_915 family protein [Streptomyces decoyicus]